MKSPKVVQEARQERRDDIRWLAAEEEALLVQIESCWRGSVMVNILCHARTICPGSMDRIAHLNAAFDGHYKIERELGAGGRVIVRVADAKAP